MINTPEHIIEKHIKNISCYTTENIKKCMQENAKPLLNQLSELVEGYGYLMRDAHIQELYSDKDHSAYFKALKILNSYK